MWIAEGNVCYVCTRLNLTCQLIEPGSAVTIDQGSTIYGQLYALASLCLPRRNAIIALLVYLHVALNATGIYIFKHNTTDHRMVLMCRMSRSNSIRPTSNGYRYGCCHNTTQIHRRTRGRSTGSLPGSTSGISAIDFMYLCQFPREESPTWVHTLPFRSEQF